MISLEVGQRKTTQNGTIKNHQSHNNNLSQEKEPELLSEKKEVVDVLHQTQKNQDEVPQVIMRDAISDVQIPEAGQSAIPQNPTSQAGQGGLGSSSKMNHSLLIDEERMILDVVYSGQIQDLKHFSMKNRSLDYICVFEPLSSLDKRLSPLIVAVYCGNIDHVKKLFSIKAQEISVGFASKPKKISPLMVACLRGQFEIAQYLISKQADVQQTNVDGQTALYYCFIRMEDEDHNLFENQNLCLKMASFLLSYGADINGIVDITEGQNLLLRACSIKKAQTPREKNVNLTEIAFLLRNGADIYQKDNWGKTCFDLIETHPNQEEVQKIFNSFEHSMYSTYRSEQGKHGQGMLNDPSQISLGVGMKSRKKSQNMLTSTSTSQYLNPHLSTQIPISHQATANSLSADSRTLIPKNQLQISIEAEDKKSTPCCSLFSFF